MKENKSAITVKSVVKPAPKNVQDGYLKQLLGKEIMIKPIGFYYYNINGKLVSYDKYTLIIQGDVWHSLIYKSSVIGISPKDF